MTQAVRTQGGIKHYLSWATYTLCDLLCQKQSYFKFVCVFEAQSKHPTD